MRRSFSRFASIFAIVAIGVAFFAGLKAVSPDMKMTADKYFDAHRLTDIRLLSTVGFNNDDVAAVAGTDGVLGVMPSYTIDALVNVRGRDLVAGLPKTIEVTSDEIREALMEPIMAIVDRVKSVLEQTPPELSSDIIERGIMLTGGVSLIRGLDTLLSKQTGIPVHVAEDPLSCVALGCGRALDQLELIRDQFIETGFEA